MEEYNFLRTLADSWGLLAMFLFFLGVVIWVFLPGRGKAHEESKTIPFRHEDAPAPDDGDADDAQREEARK
ncbi:cbb3-type cytochrome c oxidase subunit 3 [Rhodosalinus sediminis]|jgi:cytochrome c oxidase cbb3-type subunit 4|uniref:Cbb3-type cytochrome c oxidase subunit 3 n=1 Tax=Rhodosalinus sediminis TaxID=1940533 RepID=A0A3D9BWM3_9RHOB|nr:cbb3-type cytochrome c oxidase subunit 3 [Rhodosalinus sediminis]REC57933.1 cbb3-type cytochrome c oxidase subunit 3 [Rhodosalinus sediminis]